MVGTKALAYDIAVENADGVTIYYNYINDGKELEVTNKDSNYPDNSYAGNIVIPEEVTFMNRTRKVSNIGSRAFIQCHDLTSVIISNNVTKIEMQAFYGDLRLNSITIGNNVTEIGESAFLGCRSLTSITIPNSVTTIGAGAFDGCTGLTSVIMGSNVKVIGEEAFSDCSGMTSVTIPSSVTIIGNSAFSWCWGLTSVHITDLAAWCNITFLDNPLHYADHLFLNGTEIKELTIPNSVTSIADGAFASCTGFDSIIIPNSVSTIGAGAFNGCTGLTSVSIPSSVISIGDYAFEGCDLLTVISKIEEPFQIESHTFSNNTFMNASLYVPNGSKSKYQTTNGWKDFKYIEEDTNSGEEPIVQKCNKPTISYSEGKLTFNSTTEGAVCYSTISDTDIASYSGNEIQLCVTYVIKVYATKEGYENSEITTATLCWIDVEPKTEGLNSVAQVRANAVMIKTNGGEITIEGADENTSITVYTLDGVQVGAATCRNGIAFINTNLKCDSIAIVKIGNKSVKVQIK